MLMGDALGKKSVRLGRCRLFRCFPTHTGLREMVSFRYFEASSILLYKFVRLSTAPPSVPALAVQSPAAPSVCLFAFQGGRKQELLFSAVPVSLTIHSLSSSGEIKAHRQRFYSAR